MLFECFFLNGYFPPDWKLSFLTPVYKTGARHDAGNYRPIANTSILCRVMERIVRDKIYSYLCENDLISQCQHGFLPQKSTQSNILESVLDWMAILDEGQSVDVIYLDLRKAFDSIVHSK